MALDIEPMDPIELQCPKCQCPLLLDWSIASYSDGPDSAQIGELRIDTEREPKTLYEKVYDPDEMNDACECKVLMTASDIEIEAIKKVGRFLSRRRHCDHCHTFVLETEEFDSILIGRLLEVV